MDSGLGAYPVGPAQAAKDRLDGRHRWIAGALVAQLFLISAYVAILTSDLPSEQIALSIAALVAFSGVYVLGVGRLVSAPIRQRIAVVAVLFALSIPQFLVIGSAASTLWIYLAVAGGMLFPPGAALALGAFLAAAMLAVDAVAGDPLGWELALTLLAMTLFMMGFAGNVRLNIELRETREQLARAAVSAERARIGRDLHDILGHSLTAIAVKAGLARRLLDRDVPAALAEIADVERLAREALADVRATASGYRDISLAGELAVASSVLSAAGIDPVLPQAVDIVDPAAREVLGFVVREAVTNVVRHSGASTCTITVGAGWVSVLDDGIGSASWQPVPGPAGSGRSDSGPAGSGLAGLAARISAQGGTLHAGPLPGGGFAVRAEMPAGREQRAEPALPAERGGGRPGD